MTNHALPAIQGVGSFVIKEIGEDMIFLGLALLLALIGGSLLIFGKTNSRGYNDARAFGGTLTLFAALFLFFGSLLPTGVAYVNQLNDIENIKRYEKLEPIYEKKSQDLTRQLKDFLADRYPAHEREIFKNLKPDNILLYLAKYPELRAADTLMKLADEVSKLRSQVYDQRIIAEQARKDMRVRERNPWHLFFVFPKH